MILALLILIVLILLFGAGVVKGWLKNALGAMLGIGLIVALMLTVTSLFGENAFWWMVYGSGALLLAIVILAHSDIPAAIARWQRRERAQQKRDEHELRAREEEEKLLQQGPLNNLLHIFEQYETRTVPATKAKAQEFYEKGDEEGLRQLVESICKRNQDQLVFDGKLYRRQGKYEGEQF